MEKCLQPPVARFGAQSGLDYGRMWQEDRCNHGIQHRHPPASQQGHFCGGGRKGGLPGVMLWPLETFSVLQLPLLPPTTVSVASRVYRIWGLSHFAVWKHICTMLIIFSSQKHPPAAPQP